MNTSVMAEMMRPQAKPIRDYRALHPFPTAFFHRIMRGVSSSPKKFISTSASRLSGIYGVEAYLEVLLFESAWHMASQGDHPLHTEFLEVTRRSLPLWTNMFALLYRSAEEDQPDNTTDKCNGTLVLPVIIFLAGAVTTHCSKMQGDSQQARLLLMHIWAHTEIISALSQSITNGVLNDQEHDGWTTRSWLLHFLFSPHRLKKYLRPLLFISHRQYKCHFSRHENIARRGSFSPALSQSTIPPPARSGYLEASLYDLQPA
jgi:hypothetical protein